jgi:hypothetical protein
MLKKLFFRKQTTEACVKLLVPDLKRAASRLTATARGECVM